MSVLFLLAFVARAAPAIASCAPAPPIRSAVRDAEAAFVGTVVELENLRRWATVEVGEVWKGDVAPLVEVRGGPADPKGETTVVTSVDRHFREGVPYLFVPFRGNGEVFRDNACTVTSRYRPEMARFRPTPAAVPSASADVEPDPQPTTEDLDRTDNSLIWLLALAVIGGGVGWFVVSRRKGP